MHAPDQYMDEIRVSKRSRYVIQARSEGTTNLALRSTWRLVRQPVKSS